MKIRIINGVKLQIVENKDYIYKHLIRCYDMIYTKFNYGCVPIINDIINVNEGYLTTTEHLYDCLRYHDNKVFVDIKTKEVMIRI